MASQSLHRTLGLAMGTLNTCLVMVLIVLSLHLSDELRAFLGSLSTALGLGIFGLLWSTTTYCTYRGWLETAPDGIDGRIGARYLEASARWGFMTGAAFFVIGLLALVLVASLLVITAQEEGSLIATWIFGILAGFFGTAIAGGVGIVLGMALATVDVLLAKLILAMLRPAPVA